MRPPQEISLNIFYEDARSYQGSPGIQLESIALREYTVTSDCIQNQFDGMTGVLNQVSC